MTLIVQLDLTKDPAVVVTLYDYGDDDVPAEMVPPAYVDVTDVDPRPEPGYTYDGETFKPGEPQQDAAVAEAGRLELEDALVANDDYLALTSPNASEQTFQIAELTKQASILIRGALKDYDVNVPAKRDGDGGLKEA
jgi:hypothetical protein